MQTRAIHQPRSAPWTHRYVGPLVALALVGLLAGCARSGQRAFKSTVWTADGVRYTQFKDQVFGGKAVVAERGLRAGPTVLLVHGVGENAAADWSLVERALAGRYRVLTVDLPGFGRSSHANKLYSPERYAQFLREVVVQIAGGPVLLVGHSMGGAVCLRFAATSPELVRRLALVDVAGVLHREAFVSHVVRQQVSRLGSYGRWLLPHAQRGGERLMGVSDRLGLRPGAALRSAASRLALLGGNPSRIAGLALMVDALGATLELVRAETLLIWGTDDPIAPLRTGYLLRARLPNARLALIAGAHHVPMKERPADFNRLLLPFLAG